MKYTALILLGAFALANTQDSGVYENGCPKDWSVEQLLPHPNCRKFYQCWDGELVEHSCPAHLYFSVEKNRCEWSAVIDCSATFVPDQESDEADNNNVGGGNCDPSQAPEICAAEGSNSVLVAHEKCNKYYICQHGVPVPRRCQAGLFFNPQTDQCDWPENVDCGDRVIPDSGSGGNSNGDNDNNENGDSGNGGGDNDNQAVGGGNCDPSQAPEICAAEGSDSVLVAHEKCNKYYICVHGLPQSVRCPAGLFFNPNTDQCDWPENVECGDRVIPDGESGGNGNGDNGNGDNGGSDNGNGGDDSDSNGNGENGSGNGDNDNQAVGGGNCDPSQAPEICAAEGSDSVLVAHERCNKYYICVHGLPQPVRCPAGLFFNPNTDQCDWPENVDCGDRVVPDGESGGNGNGDNGNGENGGSDNGSGGDDSDNQAVGGGNCDPSQAPDICAAEGSDSVLVAHERCNKYYICVHGLPQPVRCPSGLFFNPNTDQCDWPENVDCGDRVVPDGESGGNGNGDNGNGENGGSDNGNGGDDNDSNGNGENGNGNGDNDNQAVGGGNCDPSQAPGICAAEGSDSVLVAHERCNKYYICVHGLPQPVRCPAGLFFNPNTDQCDWPENVDCGDRVVPDGESGGNGNGDNGNGDNGGSDNGNGGDDNDSNGNGENGNGNGDNDNQAVGGGNCDPSQAPDICAAEGSDSVLVAHERCNKYYICVHGLPQPVRCPSGLFFNPNTDQCDWPENVDCGDRVVPDGESGGNGNGDNGNGENGGSDNGNGGDDNDSNGNGENGNGNGDNDNQAVGGGNCDPSQAPEICAAEGSDSVLVAHERCNKYYICVHGLPQPVRCPSGLFFNPNTDQCDWPENVDCGDRVVPDGESGGNGNGDNGNGENGGSDNGNGGDDNDSNGNGENGNGNGDNDNQAVGGGNCDPSQAPEICAAEGSDSVLVAHERCNKYYICVHGLPQPVRCPSGLFFNPNTDQCDWPENVDCGDRVVPDGESGGNGNGDNGNGENGGSDNGNGGDDNDSNGNGENGNGNGDNDNQAVGGGNCDPSQAPEICAAEGSDSVLVAHERCNKYYICVHGLPQPVRCPAGLFFNPNTDQCDWPENVDCGDRVVPDGESGGNGNGDNGNGDNGGSDNGNGGDDNDSNGNGENGNGNGDNDNQAVGGGNCDPSQAPEICAAEGSDSVLVAHERCNKYYICVHGLPQPVRCPSGLFFNPNTDQCDWPENVDCGDRVVPDGESGGNGNGDNGNGENGGSDNGNGGDDNDSNGNGENGNGNGDNDNQAVGGGNCDPSQAPEICAAEGSDSVLVAHERCNKYYICVHGLPQPVRCPSGLFFNPNTDQCDWPENVDCGDRVVPDGESGGNGNGDNGNGENGGSDNGNGGDDNDSNGNGENGNGNGDNDNQAVGGGNCDPSQAPEICAAESSDSVLVAHEKCNKYYICLNGVPQPRPCPAGLFFNPNTDQCDWPENVNCGDRVIPDGESGGSSNGDNENNGNSDSGNGGGSDNGGSDNDSQNVGECNCNPGEAPAICAAEGSDNVLIAHEKCNQFYICDHGLPVSLRCPPGLLYNPYIQTCDWPNNVECGDRVIPDEDDEDNNSTDNGGTDNGGTDNGGTDNGGDNNGGNGDDNQNGGQCNCNPGEAPAICEAAGSDNVLIAHEKCNQFYICNHGLPISQRCPPGLLYNPYIQTCDWPHNIECGDRVIPEGDEDNNGSDNGGADNGGTDNGGDNNGGDGDDNQNGGQCNCNPGQAPVICALEGSDNVLIAHEKCNKYYICNHGLPVSQRCPPGLRYNPYIQTCDWPHNVECGDRVIPEGEDEDDNGSDDGVTDNGGDNNGGNGDDNQNGGQCNCNPGEAPAICAADGSDNVLIAHEQCNKFFICNNGLPVTQRCPAGLLFNPYLQICDWPQNVECGDRVISDKDDEVDNGSDNGTPDNGGDNNGGNGDDNQNGGQCNCNPGEAPEICAAEGSENVLIAHEQCNKFFICNNGLPVTQRCPAGLLFNPYLQICDWPQNVVCGDRVIPDGVDEDSNDNNNGGNENDNNGSGNPGTCNCDASEAPQICAADGSNNVLVAHEECNKYYVCANGEPVSFRCPSGLLYNPYIEQCDWSENFECTDKVNPEVENNNDADEAEEDVPVVAGNNDPSLVHIICADEKANGVFVAHEICTQFYTCSNGKPVTLRCPANLLFNPGTDQCDWPHFVNCDGRVIPSNFDGSLNKHVDARHKLMRLFK